MKEVKKLVWILRFPNDQDLLVQCHALLVLLFQKSLYLKLLLILSKNEVNKRIVWINYPTITIRTWITTMVTKIWFLEKKKLKIRKKNYNKGRISMISIRKESHKETLKIVTKSMKDNKDTDQTWKKSNIKNPSKKWIIEMLISMNKMIINNVWIFKKVWIT